MQAQPEDRINSPSSLSSRLAKGASLVSAALLASAAAAFLEWGLYSQRTGGVGYLSVLMVLSPVVLLLAILAIVPVLWVTQRVNPRFEGLFVPDAALRRRRLFWALIFTMLLLALIPYPLFRVLQELARTVTSAAVSRIFISFASVMALGVSVVGCAAVGFGLAWSLRAAWVARLKPNLLWVWTFAFPFPFLWLPLGSTFRAPVAFTPAARLLVPALIVALVPPFAWLLGRLPKRVAILAAATLGLAALVLGGLGISGIQFRSAAVLRAPFTVLFYEPLRSAADLDGDGFTQLWEGRDCNEDDPSVHDRALDVPGNGVDENCDGEDAASDLVALDLGPNDPFPYADAKPYNVVVIVLDAVRADHVRSFGYARDTTPNLDQLVQQSLAFSQAYSQYPSTGGSIPSILAGRYPHMLTWLPPRRRADFPLSPDNVLVSDTLRNNGYFTGAVLSNWLPSHILGLVDHFDVVYPLGDSDEWKRIAYSSSPISTAKGIEFLNDRPKGRPFFLLLHYADPHAPYVTHKAPGRYFGARPQDRYDSDIHWTDLWMGLFLHYLDHVDLWQDTVVVVLADHGEEFEEHGMKNHGNQLHVESLHVPLVVRVPGMESGRVIEEPVALIDVVPTILDLVGIEDGRKQIQGQSLLGPAFAGPGDAQRPIFSLLADREPGPTRRAWSVLVGESKLILDPDEGTTKLYNLRGDPAEQWDISGTDLDTLQKLRDLLDLFASRAHPSFLEF